MLRLRSYILTHLLSSPSASRVPLPLHHLISAAADLSPIHGFAVEEYLVGTYGLTRAQAHKVSTKLSRLKSPSKPDAALSYLASLGLSSTDVAAAIVGDPKLLCTDVDKTLASNVAGLTVLGLSRSQIAQLVTLGLGNFRCRSIVSKLQYYLPIFDSAENLVRTLRQRNTLLSCNLNTTVKPNIALLQEHGIDACDIGKLGLALRRILTMDPKRLQVMVVWDEGLGVPRK